MKALRSTSYRLYARLPIGLNRQALFAWTFILAVFILMAFSINHWLNGQHSAENGTFSKEWQTSLDASEFDNNASEQDLEQSSNQGFNQDATPIVSTLDQQAHSWEALEDIELVGLVHSSGKQSFAIIRWQQEQLVVSGGERIPGKDDISVGKIQADSITLNGPWGEKRLGLNGKELAENNGVQHFRLPQLRRIILSEPDSITDHIQAKANYDQGKLLSLSLSPGQSTALFNKAGLKTGDQLTHINNTPIAELGLTALPKLMREESMILRITRRNIHHELTLFY